MVAEADQAVSEGDSIWKASSCGSVKLYIMALVWFWFEYTTDHGFGVILEHYHGLMWSWSTTSYGFGVVMEHYHGLVWFWNNVGYGFIVVLEYYWLWF